MSNSILHVELRDHSLVPAEAEVHVTLVPARLDSGTEARGRLMGPRCRFASTVEVAYHFRPLLVPTNRPAITLRAIIPEASFWEPQSPHLYAGPLELWQGGVRCEVVQLRHGLRHLTIGPRGLRLNGRVVRLRGRSVEGLDDAAALALREAGYNLAVAPVREETRGVWEVADRIGLFVLGWLEGSPALAEDLAGHPCCLGWLVAGDADPGPLPVGTFLGGAAPTAAFRTARAEEVVEAGGMPLLVVDAPAGFDSESALLGVVERG